MTDVVLALLGVGVALLGAWVAGAGVSPLRPRRLAGGAALLGVAGLALWLRLGAAVPLPRAVTVVFTDAASAADLADAVDRLADGDRVCWLRVGAADGGGPPARWVTRGEAGRRPGEADAEYLGRVRGAAVPVRAAGDDWFAAVARADAEARRSAPAWFRAAARDSVLLVLDRGEVWGGLPVRAVTLGGGAAALADPPRDLFVLPAASGARVGQLELDVSPEVLPAVPLIDLGTAAVTVRLGGADAVRRAGAKCRLDVWVDGGPGLGHLAHYTRELTDPGGDAPVGRFALNALEPVGDPKRALAPGFHRILVHLKVPVGGPVGHLQYEASRYVQVEDHGVVVLARPGGLGALADRGWDRDVLGLPSGVAVAGESPGTLLKNFLASRADVGQAGRTGLAAQSVRDLGYPASAAERESLGKALDARRVLILVEPTAADLAALEPEVRLEARIEAGLTVVVIGPPVPAAKSGWPKWLGWESEAVPAGLPDAGTPRRVHQDRRVYFVPECARVTHYPTADGLVNRRPDERTALTAQRDVINAATAALKARDAIGEGAATELVAVENQGQNQFLKTVGENRARFGEAAGPGGTPVLVRTFPVASRFVRMPDRSELDRRRDGELFVWETVASFLPPRTEALRNPPGVRAAGFDGLDPSHEFPGSAVVVFAADLPQPAVEVTAPGLDAQLKVMTGAGEVGGPFPGGADPAEAVRRFARQGAAVYVVPIRFPVGHAASLRAAARGVGVEDARKYWAGAGVGPGKIEELPALDFSGPAAQAEASVTAVREAVVKRLTEHPTAALELGAGGRVVDDRARSPVPAPHVHRVLRPTAAAKERVTGEWAPPHAVIRDPRRPEGYVAVASERVGRGRVVVTAYSPFAADVWHADAGEGYVRYDRGRAPAAPRTDGWGVQRLLDPSEMTTPPRNVPPQHPVVHRVETADDGATVRLDCWADFREHGLPVPELWADGGARPLATARVVSLDRVAGLASFELRNPGPDPWQGFGHRLHLHKTEATAEARPRLFLSLAPGGGAGRSLREALDRVAAVTGGRTLPPLVPGAVPADRAVGAYRRPAGWFAGLGVVAVLAAAFSPLVRPWAWLRADPARTPAGDAERRAAAFDVDATLTEWGLNPGVPRSARQAGLPAGQKVYEGGDSLATARPETLFPFAGGGRVLPPRRPVVRRRHVVRAMEAVVLIDHSPGLLSPGVGGYFRLVVRILVGAVWQGAGAVRVVPADPPDAAGWGPRSAGDDASDLDGYLAGAAGRPPAPRLALPPDLEPGHVLFVVSDLLAPRENDLPAILAAAAREGVDVRVVLVQPPPAPQAGVLGVSAASGRLVDRSEWAAEDVAAAQAAHADTFRRFVEGEGGRFVAVPADGTGQDVFERLAAAGFLT